MREYVTDNIAFCVPLGFALRLYAYYCCRHIVSNPNEHRCAALPNFFPNETRNVFFNNKTGIFGGNAVAYRYIPRPMLMVRLISTIQHTEKRPIALVSELNTCMVRNAPGTN